MEPLFQLMYVFFKIGFFSIGGGYAIIPLIREEVVIQSAWISQQTFTDIITISQMTPGPLAVNTSTFIGLQIAGIPGAVLATISCVVSGVVIAIMLYHFFIRFNQSNYVFQVLNGLKAASLGLIMSAAATILTLSLTGSESLQSTSSIDRIAAGIFLATLFCLRRWRIHPVFLILISGIIGMIAY